MENVPFFVLYFGLHAVLIGLVICAIIIEYRAQNPAILFWLAISGIYVLPSMTDPFRRRATFESSTRLYELYASSTLLRADLFAVGFTVCYLIVRLLLVRHEMKVVGPRAIQNLPAELRASPTVVPLLRILMLVAIAGAVTSVMAIYVTSGWAGVMSSGYMKYRLETNDWLLRISIFLVASIGGGVFIGWATRRWTAVAVIGAATTIYFLLSFTRQMLMFIALPFAIYILHQEGWRNRAKQFVLAIGAYYAIILLQVFRYFGTFTSGMKAAFNGQLVLRVIDYLQKFGGEADLRLVYYFLIDQPWPMAKLIPGQTYIRMLMLPIPNEFALGYKPRLTDMTLFYWFLDDPVNQRAEGGSMHALMFGDAYVNFGWFAILLGAFWAFAVYWMNCSLARKTPEHRVLLLAPISFACVMMARGSIYNSSAYVLWSFLLAAGFVLVSRIRFVRHRSLEGVPV